MTFTQLAKQWAPNTRSYPSDIKAVADRFMNGLCKDADPNPEMMVDANGKAVPPAATAAASTATAPPKTKGDELAKRANDEARADGSIKSGLGASALAKTALAAAAPAPDVKILNAAPAPAVEPAASAADEPKPAEAMVEKIALSSAATAGAGTAAAKPETDAKSSKAGKPASSNCHVFTASYGGDSAVIVKANAGKVVNYTVLHVNEGSEKREAEAYIAAYAKGGETVGSEFKNQDQALDKAFELCPEG